MTGRVVAQKVRRPEPGGLCRPRLEQRLLGSHGDGLALVVAPPGSGKTTVLAQVAALPGRRSAWYCVGPEDGRQDRFVRHLAHALACVTSAVDPSIESVDELLIALQGAPHPLLLVVDDLHEVSGSPAEAALERFVRLRPRSVTVLLGSRRTPDMNISRLLASGELVELGVDDLRFRSWEVEELYRRVYQEPLSPESAAALTRRTEGWAAALQLFHLSTTGRERSVRESAVADLSGRSRLIRSYLTRNVIAELPPERREFLVTTSTLGVLTGSMCDELASVTGSLAVLQDLESRQFFTTSIDDGQTYRYHEILRSHLEVLLVDRVGEPAALQLYARAAKILETHGFGQAALRAYARAQEWGAVARLLRDSRSGLSVDDVLTAPGCRSAPLSREDPWMALSQARRLVRHGDLAAALAAFGRARELADDDAMRRETAAEEAIVRRWTPDPDPEPAPAMSAVGGRRAVPVTTLASASDTASIIRQATVAVLPGASASAPTVLARAVLHLLSGQFEQARELLDRSGSDAAHVRVEGWEVMTLSLLRLLVGVVDDTVVDPDRQLEELCLTADVQGYAWLARIGRDVQAWVLTPDPGRWSPTSPTTKVSTDRVGHDAWGGMVLGLVAGITLLRQGEAVQARPVLRYVAERAAQSGAPVVGFWAAVLRLNADAATAPGADRGVDRGVHRGVDRGAPEALRLKALALRLGIAEVDVCSLRFGSIRPEPDTVTEPVSLPGGSGTELTCLGGLSVRAGGTSIDLGLLRPRARTLLYLLSVRHGHDVHREELIDVLWPGTAVEVGTHRLHVAASSVRRLLSMAGCGPDPVRRNGDAYRLDLQGVRSDVAHFEADAKAMTRALAEGEPARAFARGLAALGRYTGHLLPEVGPADWVVPERERLRVFATSVAIDVARLAPRLDRLEDGRRAAQRAVELDPLRDTGWLLLAQHQEALGEPSAAAITRREHQRLLAVLGAPS